MKGIPGLVFPGKNGGRSVNWGPTWGTQSPVSLSGTHPWGWPGPSFHRPCMDTALGLERCGDGQGQGSREGSPNKPQRFGNSNP